MDPNRKIPDPLLPKVSTENRQIGSLYFQFQEGLGYQNPNLPKETRFVLGFPLPLFQRELCWTESQKIRFIESAWNQFHLGIYTVNQIDGLDAYHHPFQDALIDGQQRLKALENYWNNQFPVMGYLWQELTSQDQIRFRNTAFGTAITRIEDEATLRLAYNLLNYGGVAHTPEQKA